MAQTYYKFLSPGRMAPYVDGFQWPEPGVWLEVSGPLVPCENGLHVLRWDQLIYWAEPELWTVEVDESEVIDHGNKVVVRRACLVSQVDAWTERTAREFACDCAERVLPIFERERPDDDRPRRAIEVARRFARGEATDSELAAAWAAARAAAWAAARSATRSAAWAATRSATRPSAWSAAWAAASPAAGAAAGAAERDWQHRHLASLLGIEVPV